MKTILQNIYRFFFPSKLKIRAIRAMHENDMDNLLGKLDLLNKIKSSEAVCFFCSTIISKENLECIISRDGEIILCCDRLDCYSQALKIEQTI